MKSQWKWVISALALIIIIPLAVFLYGKLSKEYAPDDLPAADTTQAQTTAAQEIDAAEEASAFEELSVPASTAAPDAAAPATTTVKAPDPTTTKAPEPPKELAADFTVYDENGNAVRLSDHFGKPLVVNFWASWCPPCCSELPEFNAAAKEYAGTVDFMMVNLESADAVKAFLKDNNYTFPVYYDTSESASNAYSVYSIPLTVFIRADGTVLTSRIGSMDASTLQSYLQQLTAA